MRANPDCPAPAPGPGRPAVQGLRRQAAVTERLAGLFSLTLSTALLAACGGGGGDGGTASAAAAPPPAASAPDAGASSPDGGASSPGGGASSPSGGASAPAGGASSPGGGASSPGGGASSPGTPYVQTPAPASTVTASFFAYPANGSADSWNRLISFDVTSGAVTFNGIAYRYAFPLSGGSGCAVSGGAGTAGALNACSETAGGQLVQLCATPASATPLLGMALGAGTGLANASIAQLQSAAAGGMFAWQGVSCAGLPDANERFVLWADGSATWTLAGANRALSMSEVGQLFTTGLTSGTDRRALIAYRQTVLGVDRYHLLGYGGPLSGSGTVVPRIYPAP